MDKNLQCWEVVSMRRQSLMFVVLLIQIHTCKGTSI